MGACTDGRRYNRRPSVWNAERDAELCRLYDEGQTQRAIAEIIGVSRKSIEGRVKKLGIRRMSRAVSCGLRGGAVARDNAQYRGGLNRHCKPSHVIGVEDFSPEWYQLQQDEFVRVMLANPDVRPSAGPVEQDNPKPWRLTTTYRAKAFA